MNRFILFLSFLFLLTGICVQASTHLAWSMAEYTANSHGNLSYASATNQKGITFFVNNTTDISSSYTTNRFFAFDSSGTKLWQLDGDSCDGTCQEKYTSVITLGNDGAIFIGYYFDNTSAVQLRLTRVSSTGARLWQQFWITPYLSVTPVISLLDNDGNLVIGINAFADSLTMEDFVVAEFDTAAGLLNWNLQIPDGGQGAFPLTEVISSLTVDSHNTIYGCGQGVNTTAGVRESYLFSISSVGTLNYCNSAGYSGLGTSISKVIIDQFDGLYVAGTFNDETYLEKYHTAGPSLIWSRLITRDTADKSFGGMVLYADRMYVLDNYRYFHPDASIAGGYWSNYHYMITAFDTSGAVMTRNDYLANLDAQATQDGTGGAVQFSNYNSRFYVLSTQQLDNSGQRYAVIEKLDESAISMWYDTASINLNPGELSFHADAVYLNFSYDNHTGVPHSYLNKYTDVLINAISAPLLSSSASVAPNPFSNSISIRLSDKTAEANGLFTLLTMQGTVLRTGRFTENADLDFSDLPAGAYLIRITQADKLTVSKVILKQ